MSKHYLNQHEKIKGLIKIDKKRKSDDKLRDILNATEVVVVFFITSIPILILILLREINIGWLRYILSVLVLFSLAMLLGVVLSQLRAYLNNELTFKE